MKICIFTASIDKSHGGPSRSTPILAKGLAQINVQTTLITIETSDMNTELVEGTGVNIVVIPRGSSMKVLEKIILKGQYDLIHAQNLWDPFIIKWLS